MPGERIGKTGETNEMRFTNAWYGFGIYSSSSLEFASCYGEWGWGDGAHNKFGYRNPAEIPGMRIVVCATLMGRSLQVSRDEAEDTHNRDPTVQSHVSPDKMEYVVFDAAQMVPCYVLHIDFGPDVARDLFDEMKNDPLKKSKPRVDTGFHNADNSPGAKVAKREALKAAAEKWFPYGFGPASGTNFVIEEIAEVDDDEEEAGEFRALRGEQDDEIQNFHERSADEKTSWFDEYQTVRTTKKDVRPTFEW